MRRKLAVVAVLLLFTVMIAIAPSFFPSELSRKSVNKALMLPEYEASGAKNELLFFGYSGCLNVCTPRLESLAEWYNTLSSTQQKRIAVRFLDISQPKDKEVPELFAQSFHDAFEGIYLSQSIMQAYTKYFQVYFAPALMREGEFDHTAHQYLIHYEKGKPFLRYIYSTYPYDYEQIMQDIERLSNEKDRSSTF